MTTLEFLKSINDGEPHKLSNPNAFDVFNDKNDEIQMVLSLKKKGLVDCTYSAKKMTVSQYWITDEGINYIKDHSKKHKFGL